ncbi:MAG TPA: LamG-like jellyroll fold domain-containing protein [Sedimentisphaerales bacterium]|nr:LamG-like jellyroll fold domain-containing protein [Sedimentisphaerales bacterium]
MRKVVCFAASILTVMICPLCACATDDGLVAWWKFDRPKGEFAVDSIGRMDDAIKGNFKYMPGASGNALRFDGYTTRIIRPAGNVPRLVEAFTIEAWIAPQTYSWNWTAIVDQAGDVVGQDAPPADLQLKPGLFGVKFNEPDFANPSGTDLLKGVEHDWTGGYSDWSGRWRGYIEAPFTGEVTFTAEVDNGLKLEINKQLVIDGWGRDKARTGKMSMEKGRKYPIVLSYYQDGDPSYLRLYWTWAGQPKTIVDESALSHSPQDEDYVKTRELGREAAPPERQQRLFLGIDSEGHLGMKVTVNGQLKECTSRLAVPLLKWSHVVGTFGKDSGINLYVNGKHAGSMAVSGVVTPPAGYDLLIGQSHKKMSPVNTERRPSKRLLSNMIFDGLIDEVKIHNRALSAEQIGKAYAAVRPKQEQPLTWRVMPSGPKDLPARFGASYCRLRYSQEWEDLWRVGPDPDILVLFDDSPIRLVFWRGTAYGAVWVTENGRWMGDQSLEATGNSTGWGCSEHMSDKQCRYSHVRIIENHDARVVVHWRYALSDIVYGISRVDKDGWGEWADEYYYIYPDAVSTRKQILHANILRHEWQETIALHQPGTRPEDNLDLEALTWGNMDGESKTYTWNAVNRDDGKLRDATIQLVNLKAENKPFIIFQPDSGLKLMRCCVEEQWSHFPWWNHWPVAQLPNDGRRTGVPDRPSHSSLAQSIEDSPIIKHDKQEKTYTAVSLYGMSEKYVSELVPLARSWNYPAELTLISGDFACEGYDKYQRAYVLSCKTKDKPSTLKFKLVASGASPLVNPALVIKDWGDAGAKLKIDGKQVGRGKSFRFGHNYTLEGSDLVVWIKKESTEPITVSISPVAR